LFDFLTLMRLEIKRMLEMQVEIDSF
jgi:hypothetical protein